jgi:pheromone shutdown protein TraB
MFTTTLSLNVRRNLLLRSSRRTTVLGNASTFQRNWSERAFNTDTVAHLRANANKDRALFIIGTSHVSKESANETRELIRKVKPDYVLVELCEERLGQLRAQGNEAEERFGEKKTRSKTKSFLRDLFEIIKTVSKTELGAMDKILAVALKSFYASLKSSGLEPGEEFRVALEEQERIGAKLVLADRAVNETLTALRQSVSVADLFSWIVIGEKKGGPVMPKEYEEAMRDGFDGLEKIKNRRLIRELREYMEFQFPSIVDTMLHQRDEIMADAIRRECKDAKNIVLVCGLAHLDGIVDNLQGEYTEITTTTTSSSNSS